MPAIDLFGLIAICKIHTKYNKGLCIAAGILWRIRKAIHS